MPVVNELDELTLATTEKGPAILNERETINPASPTELSSQVILKLDTVAVFDVKLIGAAKAAAAIPSYSSAPISDAVPVPAYPVLPERMSLS